jgi:glycosyltransferase 2 family protein
MTAATRRTGQEHRRVDRRPAISPDPRPTDRRATTWARARLAGGAVVLLVLVWRLGTGPFLDGLRLTSGWALLIATAVTALTTLCCAWRWQLVAARLGLHIGLVAAFAAVYRAQFLNATLPGGVLGDVHRAVDQGFDTGALGPGVRSVLWERTLGQVVQVVMTIVVLVLVPSPLQPVGAWVAVGSLALAALILSLPSGGRRVPGRLLDRLGRAAIDDVRAILRTWRVCAGVVLLSGLAVAGHLAVFVLAAHVAGVSAPAHVLVPLAAAVVLAAGVPLNIAGWGPREGAAAWAFGAVGLGFASGVTTAVVYGVMALVATLPGAVALAAGSRILPRDPADTEPPVLEGAARG